MTDIPRLKSGSIAKSDQVNFKAVEKPKDSFEYASSISGKTKQQLLKEISQCRRWPGKITRSEYFAYRLYEKDACQQKDFLSEWLHWPIHDFCEDSKWSPITVDKIATINVLNEGKIPTIQNAAVVDRSGKKYSNQLVIHSEGELVEFLREYPRPLFCKPLGLLASFGVFKITTVSEDAVRLEDNREVPFGDLIKDLMGNMPYVLQPVIQNHSAIKEFAAAVATIRTMNFISDNVKLVQCVLKIPVRDNIADNAWRQGNLVADVDIETGIIKRVVEGAGSGHKQHAVHPDSGHKLVGMQLPHWDALVALNQRTAELFSAIKYLTLDLAITETGPMVVEVNSGGSFTLPQIASGEGFLTDKNKAFFESCGVKFELLPSTTKLALLSLMRKFNPFA